jgi:succinate dehydrogenase hydrophobic anchor subunit
MNNLIEMRYKIDKKSKDQATPSTTTKSDIKDHLTPKQPGKTKVMLYAFAPFILTNLLSTLILLIGLPSVTVANTSLFGSNQRAALTTLMAPIFSSSVWAVVDVLQIITLAIWIPICMSIALRDLANTSTTKLLIGCIVMGILISYMFYFLRPTLGWNLNIIQQNI